MQWKRYLERRRRDEDLAAEIAHHIAQETDDNVARGLSPEDARVAALRKFGNRRAVREAVYDRNSIGWLEVVLQDLRYALRQLRRRPGFAFAAITSLSLGIGANTAIFTLVDQILLRMLPVQEPRQLVQLRLEGTRPGGNWGDGLHTFPYPTYLALRDQNTVFSGVTGQRVEPISLLDEIDGGGAALVTVAMVSGNYFDVFGVRPHFGRLLTPADDRDVNGHPVAILQYDFWQSHFQGRTGIIGESIRLNGVPFTIIGVAARGFEGTNVGSPARLFVPITMQASIVPNNPGLDDERAAWFYLFARLKPGVSRERAEAAMKVLYRQRQQVELQGEYFGRFPESRTGFLQQVFSLEPGGWGASSLRTRFEQPLVVLGWLSGAVLLIACANIAGLLLARGAANQRDLAVRRAIGASRGRLVAQLFTESVLLAGVSAVAALFVGSWLTRLMMALLPMPLEELSLSATPDLRILGFTGLVTVLTAVLFGLLPAWQNSRVPPSATMREEAGSIAGGRGHMRVRKMFVGLQVALSAVLLLGAGLFIRSLDNMRRVDLGLESENVVTFLARPAVGYDGPHKVQAFGDFVRALENLPGVVVAGANRTQLFTGGRTDGTFTVAGAESTSAESFSFFNAVTPGYFAALGIPVKAGADFDWRDWGSGKKLAMVNEALAAKYFAAGSPLDRRISQGTRTAADWTIVGVFGNARYHDVRGEIPAQTFFNLDSLMDRVSRISVYVRVAGDPHQFMATLRQHAQRLDPNLVITGIRTLDDQIDSRMSNERILSFLSIGFAVLATVLAVVGVHGVLVFQIARRTREIGVRMALGAQRGPIVRLVAGEMALVILAGLAGGVATAYACGRWVQSQLFQVPANDPLVFAIAVVALLGAAGLATFLPAIRASRMDVVRALRYE
jgi:predicted permease